MALGSKLKAAEKQALERAPSGRPRQSRWPTIHNKPQRAGSFVLFYLLLTRCSVEFPNAVQCPMTVQCPLFPAGNAAQCSLSPGNSVRRSVLPFWPGNAVQCQKKLEENAVPCSLFGQKMPFGTPFPPGNTVQCSQAFRLLSMCWIFRPGCARVQKNPKRVDYVLHELWIG